MSQKFLPPREAAAALGVHRRTLTRWEQQGKIVAIRTPSGQRRYDVESYQKKNLNYGEAHTDSSRLTITYARVSSRKQKVDLDRQVAVLTNLYPHGKSITDIGSGLNYKRQGLIQLLKFVLEGKVKLIIIAHKDRLVRFGFELIEWLCTENNCKIIILNQETLSPEKEMIEDILSIVHIFSCRLYGLRKYKKQISSDVELQ
ncbi:MAG: IS607 family transposase [Symploca sp. SIO2E6]|nr:IS607 family transposase [Symploca sp. SIO2E6]